MLKKILSLIITVTVLLGCVSYGSVFAASVNGGMETSDVAQVLKGLGIVEGDLDPLAKVTRKEFVKAAMHAYGTGSLVGMIPGEGFTDVDGDYAGYIYMARQLGFVSGSSSASFEPDAEITFNQALKILVTMLGYEPKAIEYGGYPEGYANIARLEDIMTWQTDYEASLTVDDMYALIYNSLTVKMMEQKGFGENISYEVTGKTLLKDYLKVNKYKAKVFGNEMTSLDSSISGLSKGKVSLLPEKGQAFVCSTGETDIASKLGYSVTVFTSDVNDVGEDTVLAYFVNKNQEERSIECRDILSVIDGKVEYSGANDKIRTLKTLVGMHIIYNGRAVTGNDYDLDIIKSSKGYALFISSDGSGVYDTVFVSSIQNALVSNVVDEKIYLNKNKHGLAVVDKNKLDALTLYLDGKEIGFDEVKQGMVASVEYSLDNSVCSIKFSEKTVLGRIDVLSEDENGRTYVEISGEEYFISYDSMFNPTVGQKAEFKINFYGELTHSESYTDRGFKYGFVMGIAVADKISGSYKIRLLDEGGSIVSVNLADKVRIDDVSMSAERAIGEIPSHSLITYETTGEGLINDITLPIDYTGDTAYVGYNEELFSKDNYTDSMYYKKTSIPTLNGMYLVPNDTIVFNVPLTESSDTDDYRVTDNSIFLNDVYYKVAVYDADKAKHTDVVVNYGIDMNMSSEEVLAWNTSIFIVDRVIQQLDEEGSAAEYVEGYMGGEKILIKPIDSNNEFFPQLGNVFMEDNTKQNSFLFSQLTQGCIIQFKKNALGEVDTFRLLYKPGDGLDMKIWNGNGYTVNLLAAVAKVSYIDENTIRISTDGDASNSLTSNRVFPLTDVNVYIYNSAKKTVEKSETSEILSFDTSGIAADTVFVRAYRDSIGDLVIIR